MTTILNMEGMNKFYKVRHDNFLKRKKKEKRKKKKKDTTRSNCDIPWKSLPSHFSFKGTQIKEHRKVFLKCNAYIYIIHFVRSIQFLYKSHPYNYK